MRQLALAASFLAVTASAGIPVPLPQRIPAELDLREVDAASARDVVKRLAVPAAASWLSGSSIARIAGPTTLLAVADTENHAVVVVDGAGTVRHTVPVGQRPERLVAGPDGRVFVACRGDRTLVIVDPHRGAVARRAVVGAEPYAVALTPDGATVLVTASAEGVLVALDATNLAERFRVTLGAWPAAIAVHPDGQHAFVTHLLSGTVEAVSLTKGEVAYSLELPTRGTGFPRTAQAADDARAAVHATAALVSPGGTRLFVAHVMADVGATETTIVAQGYGLGVARPLVATVSTFDLTTKTLLRSPVAERGVKIETLRDKKFRTLEEDAAPFGFIEEEELARLSQPVALAMDPVFARLLLVSMGSDRVTALDAGAADPIGRPLQGVKVGHAPRGVALSADGRTAFVHNAQGFSISRIDLAASAFQEEFRFDLKAEDTFAVAKDPLSAEAALGRRLFTYALDERVGGVAHFACAGCHPDGRHDGLVWRVGEGPRQTPILAGRLEGTGPYNWLGTELHLEENVTETIGRLGGGGLDPKETKALATYITHHLPGLDRPAQAERARVVRGRALFESAETGCSNCHSGDHGDAVRHEVGTGAKGDTKTAFDTPSLRHLWASAPYLHDGSATTLAQLVELCGDTMGRTKQLTAADKAALAAYLATM